MDFSALTLIFSICTLALVIFLFLKQRDRENQLEQELFILDETSMIDTILIILFIILMIKIGIGAITNIVF